LSRLYALEAKVQSLPQASTSQAETVGAATESDTPTTTNNSNSNNNNTTRASYEVDDAPIMSGIATPPRDSGSVDGMGEVHLTEVTEDSTYFGTSSNAAFIRQLSVALTQVQTAHQSSKSSVAFCRLSVTGSQYGEANKRRENPSEQQRRHDIVGVTRSSLPHSGSGHHVPPEPEATNLIHHYFNTLGLFFPCIHPDAFLATYRQLRKTGFVGACRLWLALLYMMIASVYQSETPSSPTKLRAEISESYFQWAKELAMPAMLISSNLETGKLYHTNHSS
jgi:hypothetical protein